MNLISSFSSDQNYYPERLGRFFFINTPMVFMIFWKIIRPWLDPVTAEKFQLLGSDYEETLHKFIGNYSF